MWNIQCDQGIFSSCATTNTYFRNAGMVQKSATTGSTSASIPFTNSGTVTVLSGTVWFTGGFATARGTVGFGLSGLHSFGQIIVSGNAALGGTASVVWLGGYVPSISNSFAVLTYGSYTGVFTNLNFPAAAVWQTNYSATAFSLTVSNISKLAFAAGPQSTSTNAGAVLAPVVVQIQDGNGNPLPTSGVATTVALSGGAGPLLGTLTQTTDGTGKATFGDLSLTIAGIKTLQVTAPAAGLAPVTASFTIIAASPAQLVLVTAIGPLQAAGAALTPAPAVQVQDQFGNAALSSTNVITARLSSSGGGHLAGLTSVGAYGTSDATVSLTNLQYVLADAGAPESVVVYFSSPGLISATNSAMMVDSVFSSITLSNGNSVAQINPTTQQGLSSWTVDGIDQVYQHWFWLREGSTNIQTSFDTLGTPWCLAYTSSNTTINYFGQGLSVVLAFALTGGTNGSVASTLGENLTLQNTTNSPINLHVFAYSDFDLAGASEGDTVSFPSTNTVSQQGKGMTLTETVQTPVPNYWEAGWYDITLTELNGSSPVTLSDQIIPQAPGDQTYAFQWDATLGAGQSLVISLTKVIQPEPISLSSLGIALRGGNIIISWTTNAVAGVQLQTTSALGVAASWSAVTNTPVVVGGQYQVSVPPAGSAQFYRLFQ
jgi:hypothetical protein